MPQPNLTDKERRFAQELLIDMNPLAAAKRAGYPSGSEGLTLLAKRAVATEIAALRSRQLSRTEITADAVLNRWWSLAEAATRVNELEQVRRVNCRYCHGLQNAYQWTPAEAIAAHRKWEKEAKHAAERDLPEPPEPDLTGGTEFSRWRDPNPECPECGGEGEDIAFRCDTRALSPAANLLYAGVESYPDGSVKRVLMRDPLAALLNVAKHLGMHIDRRELSGPGGEPLEIIVKVVKPPTLIEGFTEAETED